MELNEIHNISNLITIPVKDFHPNFEESYLYDLVSKYQDKVIAWESDHGRSLCRILLRGKIKYFMIRFNLQKRTITRIQDRDMGRTFSDQVLVTNPTEFERFKKVLIINSLEETNHNEKE